MPGHARAAALDLRPPRRLGPVRGMGHPLPSALQLQLAIALHMVRALLEALAGCGAGAAGEEAEGWEASSGCVNAHERGAKLLHPSSCRCIVSVVATGLHAAAAAAATNLKTAALAPAPPLLPAEGLLGWGRGEAGRWLALLLPAMWRFSRWRTFALASRIAALSASAADAASSHAYIHGLQPVFLALLRPTLMENDSEALDSSDLEANCVRVNPFRDVRAPERLPQMLGRESQVSLASELGLEHVNAVLHDLSALASIHRFWVSPGGPAASVAKRQEQRRAAGGEMMTFDTLRLDLSDEQAARIVALTNPPGAHADYLERPTTHARHVMSVSCVVCFRRWRALGVLEHVVPLLLELSYVLLRPKLSPAVRETIHEFVAADVVPLLLRRIAVWTSLNRSRPWEYEKIERGLEVVIMLFAMPSAQLAALTPVVTDTLVGAITKLSSSLEHAMQQLTMRNNNDAAFTKEALRVCERLEHVIEDAITAAADDEGELLLERLGPLMSVLDHFS